jgi:hypothetical protein
LEAVRQWPGRFGVLLFDLAGQPRAEVAAAVDLCSSARLGGLFLCGPLESVRLPNPLPQRVHVVTKPISVADVVSRTAEACQLRPSFGT